MSYTNETSWVCQAITNEDIKNYTVTFTGSVDKGNTHSGRILFAIVDGIGSDGNKKQIHLVVKDNFQTLDDSWTPMYLREIKVYDEILPAFLEFQREGNVKNPFVSYPKCYRTFVWDNGVVLVMQNVQADGYRMYNMKNSLDFQHLLLVVREYAKFHAVSLALRHLKPDLYQKLTADIPDRLYGISPDSHSVTMFVDPFRNILDILTRYYEFALVKEYMKMEQEIVNMISKVNYASERNSVIIHGDSWKNNYLFHYIGEIPDKVVFIDWQCNKVASPVFDLVSFFYSWVHLDNLDQVDNVLNVYYESLSSSLHELGCDSSKLYGKHVLTTHWKMYAKLGLIYASFSRQKPREEGGDFNLNNQEFDKGMIKLVRHFVENDYIT